MDMIRSLVPEASVIHHNLFSHDVKIHARDEVESGEIEVEIRSKEKNTLRTPNSGDDGGRNDQQAEQFPADMPPVSDREPSDIDGGDFISNVTFHGKDHETSVVESTSLTIVPIADSFSVGWIGTEAYRLLELIQREILRNHDKSTAKVLIAGHGFGGIVIKQVHTSPQLRPLPGPPLFWIMG